MKIQQCLWLIVAGAVLSCQSVDGIMSFPQVERNPNDCTNNETICTSKGLICDPTTKSCSGDGCNTVASCTMPSAAVCNSNACIPCSMDVNCTNWTAARNVTPMRSYCVSIGQVNTCAECRPAMGNADCDPNGMRPVCDISTGVCRGCRADNECPLGICRKLGDYPINSPIAGLLTGQCVPANRVAYVDKDSVTAPCSNSNPGTRDQPYCSVANAMTANQQYIYVAGNTQGHYPLVTVSTGSFVIVGPGRNANPTATFDQVDVSGGTLVVSGAQIIAPLVTFAAGCRANGRLYLLNTVIQNETGRGVDASQDCLEVVVEKAIVTSTRSGIVIGTMNIISNLTTSYRIVNTAVVDSGSTIGQADPDGVHIGSLASGYFAFNTITRNKSGVTCDGFQPIYNSIITNNTPPTGDISKCVITGNQVVTNNVLLDTGPAGTEPKLQNNPQNDACCVDKALPPMGNEMVPSDYYGILRPQGNGYDIGFQELK